MQIALNADVAELVDALDLGSSEATRGSSSLPVRTNHFYRIPHCGFYSSQLAINHYTGLFCYSADSGRLVHFQGIILEKVYKHLEGCLHQVEITLTRQEREPYYFDAYKKARREIDIKGFRKGRVPINLIKQRFGKSIEYETDQDILTSEFNKLVREDQLDVIGQPKITEMDNEGDNLVFKVEYEVLPEFQLADYKGIIVDEPVHTVSDEEVEEQINKICENNGKFENAGQVDGDLYVVGLKLEEIDENTKKPIEDAEPEETNIYLKDPNVSPELKRSVLNTKVGDTFEYSPEGADKTFNVTVTDIQKLIPVEFTNGLAREISNGRFESADEYREEIGYSLQEQWDKKSREEMENQIVNTMIDAHDFQPPESIVAQVADAMVEDFLKRFQQAQDSPDFDKEQMRQDLMPAAERNVRWEIIRNKIIEKEGLEVEDYDYEALVEAEAQRYNTDTDTIRKAIQSNKGITADMLAKKAMGLLLDFAITNEVPFDEITKGHDHEHDHNEESNTNDDGKSEAESEEEK